MTELFLIAHRCRGEPTFDVAERMVCPVCGGEGKIQNEFVFDGDDCVECDGSGFWWILSTCGYRAHPWWSTSLEDIDDTYQLNFKPTRFTIDATRELHGEMSGPGSMPPTALDCFPINSPSHKSLPNQSNDLLTKLGLTPKLPPLRRL